MKVLIRCLALFLVASTCALGQVIEFELNGLKYQTLTKSGVTVMFASIPSHIKGYAVLQIAVSNGSRYICSVEPEEFTFRRDDGTQEKALPPSQVVKRMLDKASRDDVIRLVGAYELGLYGLQRMQSTNGYEQRRQTAIGEVGGTKIKAAAAASAIALVKTKLTAGQATDGAVFYNTEKRPLGAGRLTVKIAGELFEFDPVVAHSQAN